MEMRAVRSLIFIEFVATAIAQDFTDPPPEPSNLKTNVDSVSDLFPYTIPGEVELLNLETGTPSSTKPGYASLYDTFSTDFFLYLHPPIYCEAVFLCFLERPTATAKGLQNLDIIRACDNSLRFLPLEQIVYHFEGGHSKEYTYVLPYAEFKKMNEDTERNYVLEAFEDFDNEDLQSQKRAQIVVSMQNTSLLLLTSSPYCHAFVQRIRAPPPSGHIVKFEPDVDLSSFFKTQDKQQQTQYIATGTMRNSDMETKLWRSGLFQDIKSPKPSNEQCCPTTFEFTGFIEDDRWFAEVLTPTATLYTLTKTRRYEKQCTGNNGGTSPLQSFRIEVGQHCDWMRICFDKSEEWCENEGNALNLIFAHDVYIPTDTEEAVMFALTSEHLVDLRVKFLLTEPAIQFEYAFSMPNIPGISHTMYLKSYREVNLDPTKLKIHVVKAAYCQGRLVNDFADIHLGFDNAQQSQCINIKSCKCYDYEKDSTQ